MKKTTILLICFMSLIFILSIANGMQGGSASSLHKDNKTEDKVYQELENNGKVRVIVELKEPEELDKSMKGLSQKDMEALNSHAREESINLIGNEKVRHRFSSLNGFSAILTQDDIRNLQANENVKKIYYDYPVKAFLQDSVPLMNATRTWQIIANGTNLTGKDESVCVIDTGVNYSHPDLGACAIKNLSLEGNIINYPLESEHNYSNDYNNTWKINYTGFSRIAVHFVNISLEYQGEFAGQDAYDRVIVYNSNGTEIASYHGINGVIQDVWTPYSDGDTIFVRLFTDAAITDYGFYIDQIINGTTNTTYNWSTCPKILYGWDFVNNDADPADDNGHGTHVAGIIAANGSIKGTAPDARIIAVKTLDSSGGGWGSDTLYGIEFCTNNSAMYNISVISMSLGSLAVYSGYCNNDALAPSINAAIAKNISVVAATGNSGSTTGISSPACVQNATAVGATDKNDAMASYTNRNNLTDLLATGSSINSTRWNSVNCISGCTCAGNYMSCSGTSMATPHASAAFALLKQFKRLETGRILAPAEIEDKLNNTGKAIYDSSTNRNYPRIDIFSAIASLDATAPNVTILSPQNITYNTRQILVNLSASDNIAVKSIWYSWNNTNYTYTISAYANFSEGSNTLAAYANDSANNTNSTNIVFSIDTIAPAITILSPQNATYNTSTLELNAALSEAGSSCSFSLDNAANVSMAMFNATYFNYTKTGLADGSHNITFSCNDTLNNANTTALRHFSVNAAPPQVTLVSPQDNSFANQAAQNVTCNTTTEASTILRNITFYLWNSSSVVYTELKNISGLSNSTAFNFSFSAEAGYKWNCLAHNNISSSFASANFTITYDITTPALTLHSPLNNSWGNSGRFNVSLSENGSSCSFSLDNGANVTMTKINSTYFNYTNSALSEAQHNITFYCNDSAGNMNSSSNILFRIDSTIPAVTLNSPASSYSTSSTSITFSYNASDNGAISSCRLLIDSSTSAYNSTSVSQSSANEIAASDISIGSHTWQVNCIDAALNEGIPSQRSFTITSSSSSSSSSATSNSGNTAPATASDTRSTYTLTGNQLKEGYTKEITKKDQFKVSVSGEAHLVKLSDLTETTATIDVSSTTQTATLSIGEEKKFDITEDNYYDLLVRLNSLNKTANKANFTIKSINESISTGINNPATALTANNTNSTAKTNTPTSITAKSIAEIIGKIIVNYKNITITIGILIILISLFMFIKKIRKWA